MQDAAGARRLRDDEQQISDEPRLRLVDAVDAEYAPMQPGERRTITITGNPTPARSRRRSPAHAQIVARPDRIALWAVMLGLFLVAVAAATAHAAPL
jgi:hypothetical protein